VTIPVLFVKPSVPLSSNIGGYHSYYNVTSTVSIPYIVIYMDNVTIESIPGIGINVSHQAIFPTTLFHEICEIVTDPYLNGYTNTYAETGDLCDRYGFLIGNVNLNGQQFLLGDVYDVVNMSCYMEVGLNEAFVYETVIEDVNTWLEFPMLCEVTGFSIVVNVPYNTFSQYYGYYSAKIRQAICLFLHINPCLIIEYTYKSVSLKTTGDATQYYFNIIASAPNSDICDEYSVNLNTGFNNLFTSTTPGAPLRSSMNYNMEVLDSPIQYFYPF
jgi:hypothetical protein